MTATRQSLEKLEALVAQASERLQSLTAECDRLRSDNRALEKRIDELEQADTADRARLAEHQEVTERVERLVAGLDELLEVAAPE